MHQTSGETWNYAITCAIYTINTGVTAKREEANGWQHVDNTPLTSGWAGDVNASDSNGSGLLGVATRA